MQELFMLSECFILSFDNITINCLLNPNHIHVFTSKMSTIKPYDSFHFVTGINICHAKQGTLLLSFRNLQLCARIMGLITFNNHVITLHFLIDEPQYFNFMVDCYECIVIIIM